MTITIIPVDRTTHNVKYFTLHFTLGHVAPFILSAEMIPIRLSRVTQHSWKWVHNVDRIFFFSAAVRTAGVVRWFLCNSSEVETRKERMWKCAVSLFPLLALSGRLNNVWIWASAVAVRDDGDNVCISRSMVFTSLAHSLTHTHSVALHVTTKSSSSSMRCFGSVFYFYRLSAESTFWRRWSFVVVRTKIWKTNTVAVELECDAWIASNGSRRRRRCNFLMNNLCEIGSQLLPTNVTKPKNHDENGFLAFSFDGLFDLCQFIGADDQKKKVRRATDYKFNFSLEFRFSLTLEKNEWRYYLNGGGTYDISGG